MAIEDDLELYNEIRPELVAQQLNRFVLIKDAVLIGVYDTFDEALNAAIGAFGTEPYLIKQVLDPEPVENL